MNSGLSASYTRTAPLVGAWGNALSTAAQSDGPMAVADPTKYTITAERGGYEAQSAISYVTATPPSYYGPTTYTQEVYLSASIRSDVDADGYNFYWTGTGITQSSVTSGGPTARAQLPLGITGDLHYEVHATRKTFTITYAWSHGTSISGTRVNSYTYEPHAGQRIPLVTPTPNAGYGGDPIWSCNVAGVQFVRETQGDEFVYYAVIPPRANGAMTISVRHEQSECTITYGKGDGAGAAIADQTIRYPGTYAFRECTYTPPTGKKFTGWLDSATGTVYEAGQRIGSGSDCIDPLDLITEHRATLELTAQYDWITSEVSLDPNGGTQGTQSWTGTAESSGHVTVPGTHSSRLPNSQSSSGVLVAPTKQGYTFDGYWENSDGTGTQYYSSYEEGGVTYLKPLSLWDKEEDTTIYAKWAPRTDTPYTIEYYYQGKNGTWPTSATFLAVKADGKTDSTKSLDASDMPPSTNAEHSEIPALAEGERYVRNLGASGIKDVATATVKPDGTTAFKMYYKIQYRTQYAADSAKGMLSSTRDWWRDRGEAVGAAPTAAAYDGYTFTGWEPEHDPDAAVQQATRYQAIFDANKYEITLNTAGGQLIASDWAMKPEGGAYYKIGGYTIEDDEFALPIPVREGYIFDGWTVSANAPEVEGPEAHEAEAREPERAVALYALADDAAGSATAGAREAADMTQADAAEPASPAKVTTIGKGTFGDLSYTALWKAIPVKPEPIEPEKPAPVEEAAPQAPSAPAPASAGPAAPQTFAQRLTSLAATGDLNFVLALGFASISCAAAGAALLMRRPRRKER